jgi:peptide/nickel transport system substrate-binding protein
VSIGVDPRNALERIRSGESDLTLSPILPADLKRFEGRREVSIKEKKPIGAIYAFFLNTSIAPFDDRRVRRAVNLAVNRKTLAGFYADQAVQTAQVIPPGIPGYKWRGVRAPDPKDAQKLIKQANLSPSERRVTIWVPRNDPPAIAASGYLKSVLEDLSLTVKITYLDRFVYEDKIGRASTKAQIGYLSWFSTLPDGGDIFGHLDGTQIKNEANPNPSYYSASDELIKEARTKSGEARDRAWTKVDDSVSEEVPWVPFANGTRSDLISSRVQGYVYHPVFGQLWSLMTVK